LKTDSAADEARRAALRRAWASLERTVPDEAERELYREAVERYAEAVALAARLRAKWTALGCPTIAEGSMRQQIPHPLVKMLAEAERDAARFAGAVGLDPSVRTKRREGRPIGASSAPDRAGRLPRRLKAVP
jgi:phage terminase small subunit